MKFDKFIYSNNKSLNICYYLILFFPVALICGPFVGEIFILLLLLLTLKISEFRIFFFEIVKKNLLIKLFFAFSVYIFFLSVVNYQNLDILKTGIFYSRYIFFSIVIFYLLSKNQNFLKEFFVFYLILISIILLDSFIQHYFGQSIVGYKKFGSRIVSFFEGEGILGSFIVRFYIFASAFYFLSKVVINKSLLLLIIFKIFKRNY